MEKIVDSKTAVWEWVGGKLEINSTNQNVNGAFVTLQVT